MLIGFFVSKAARIGVIDPRKQHHTPQKTLQKTHAARTLAVRPNFASRIAALNELPTIPRAAPDSKIRKWFLNTFVAICRASVAKLQRSCDAQKAAGAKTAAA
jgi:hypothetical protein